MLMLNEIHDFQFLSLTILTEVIISLNNFNGILFKTERQIVTFVITNKLLMYSE